MDILGILAGIKGKVLDAANFELLRSAYDLQNQNVDQLKSNNAAITENNQLLREQCERLEEEIGRLKAENASLRAEQTRGKTTKIDYAPTGITLEILKLYRQVDSHVLYDEQVAPVLRHSKLEIEVAFSELSEHEIVSLGSIGSRGAGYYLTTAGKKLVLQIRS
jgi:SMC interacting uncharacterized protein involved in chromosome segregation